MQIKLIILLILIVSVNLNGQKWNIINKNEITDKGIKDIIPDKFTLYALDDEVMKSLLWSAPSESGTEVNRSNTFINIGLPDEVQEIFRIVRYDMMELELAAKFPDIRTFYGIAVSNPLKSVRIDYTIQGFRAVVNSPEDGKIFIDHYQRNDKNTRIVYYKNDYINAPSWGCGVTDEHINLERPTSGGTRIGDCQLRSYRLAQATTGEYSTFHGGTTTSVMSAVVNVINRINQVYEAEVAVRLILVANTDQIFYLNAGTDPYANTSGDLNANQTTCTNVIGSANYDIGHLFGTGGGGVAQLGSVCSSSGKARGLTGSGNPVGDPFTIDYVAHEMGHQFAGNHTFAGWIGSCSGNRNSNASMEPGSGTTIMSYAGICDDGSINQNVQNNSDAYFHAKSLDEIKTFISGTGNSCAQIISSFVNSAPIVTSQTNYSIPVSTPFVLSLSATDPNSNPLTYAWDQMNAVGTTNFTTPPASSNSGGPMSRSIAAATSPSRYFPPLANVIANTPNTWNVLPSVARSMSFRGIVRDFTGVAGCNSEITLTVSTVNAASGAFSVTSFNTASTWYEGESKTITWAVANTNVAPVSAANVDILLSYDGGNTFPVVLTSATTNDGSHEITVPAGTTSQARVMVRGSGHIFYDINDANITINNGFPNFELEISPSVQNICLGESKQFIVNVQSILGFNNAVNLSLSGLPNGMTSNFTTNPLMPGNVTTLTITNNNAATGTSNFTTNGISGALSKNITASIQVFPSLVASPNLLLPTNNATDVTMPVNLSWSTVTEAQSYDIEISLTNTFNTAIVNTNVPTNTYQPVNGINGSTEYFWRVRAVNPCETGNWSAVNKFETQACFIYSPTDLPIAISASGAPTVNSYLDISDRGTITDMDVLNLIGLHTYVDDLRFTLVAPSGTSVQFWNRPCGNHDNFNINFNQSAANSNWPCPPIDGGTYIPSASLNSFNNLQMKGQWRMQVQDVANDDGGSFQSWKIKTCVTNFCRLKVDNNLAAGVGSLAFAVNCANSGDTIRFAANLANQTIDLGSNQLVIDKSLVFEASPSDNINLLSSGSNATITNNADIKIIGLQIYAPNALRAAIQNNKSLTLENVTLFKYNDQASVATLLNNSELIIIGDCKIEE